MRLAIGLSLIAPRAGSQRIAGTERTRCNPNGFSPEYIGRGSNAPVAVGLSLIAPRVGSQYIAGTERTMCNTNGSSPEYIGQGCNAPEPKGPGGPRAGDAM